MAWIHFAQQVSYRSSDKLSSVGYSAYIRREDAEDEREGRRYSWSRKEEDVAEKFLVPGEGAPEWVREHAREGKITEFWQSYEDAEDRYLVRSNRTADAEMLEERFQKAMIDFRVTIALPRELNPSQLSDLTRDFVRQAYTEKGITVSYSIHKEEENPHLHIQGVTRRLTDDGVGPRLKQFGRYADREPLLRADRELFAEVGNSHLIAAGFDPKLDHRTLEAQGINLDPMVHEGFSGRVLAADGKMTPAVEANWLARLNNTARLMDDPAIILRELFATRATVTEADIKTLLFKRVSDEKFDVLAARIMAHPELIRVGTDVFGKDRFTSEEHLSAETKLQSCAETLAARTGHQIDADRLRVSVDVAYDKIAADLNLAVDPAAREAIHTAAQTVMSPRDLTVLEGWAGAGKTTLIKVLRTEAEASGYTVRGFALAGAAAEGLERSSGIPSSTIDSYLTRKKLVNEISNELATNRDLDRFQRARLEQQRTRMGEGLRFTARDVVFVDEFGMVGSRHAAELIADAVKAGAKIVLVGDRGQFKPVAGGDAMRLVTDIAEREGGYARLDNIVRQKVEYQRLASEDLARGDVRKAVETYADHGNVHLVDGRDAARQELVDGYFHDRDLLKPGQTQQITAFTREDVDALNRMVQERAVARGEVNRLVKIGDREFGIGDRIMFLTNMKESQTLETLSGDKAGVKNSNVGRLTSVYEQNGDVRFVVALEGSGRKIMFEPKLLEHDFMLGYAATSHKLQGATVAYNRIMASPYARDGAGYVQLTRHEWDAHIHGAKEDFADVKSLADSLGRPEFKDNVADYSSLPEKVAAKLSVVEYRNVRQEAASLLSRIELESAGREIVEHPEWGRFLSLTDRRTVLAGEILANAHHTEAYTEQAGISREKIKIDAGLIDRPLSDAEKDAIVRLRSYGNAVAQARDSWNAIKETHPAALSRRHPDFEAFDALRDARNKMAAEIVSDARLYRRHSKVAGVSWRTIKTHASEIEYAETMAKRLAALEPQDRLAAVRVDTYETLSQQSRTANAVGNVELRDMLSMKAQAMAAQIERHLGGHEDEIAHVGLDYNRLAQDAGRYEIRSAMKAARAASAEGDQVAYLSAMRRAIDAVRGSEKVERFAASSVKAIGGNWSEIKRVIAAEDRSTAMARLIATATPAERTLAVHVEKYADLADRAHAAWKAGDIEQSARLGTKAQALAKQIGEQPERYRAALETLGIGPTRLQADAARGTMRSGIGKAAHAIRAGDMDGAAHRVAQALRIVGAEPKMERIAAAMARASGIKWAPLARHAATVFRNAEERQFMAAIGGGELESARRVMEYRDLSQHAALLRVSGDPREATQLSERAGLVADRIMKDMDAHRPAIERFGVTVNQLDADASRFTIRDSLRALGTADRSSDEQAAANALQRLAATISRDDGLEKYAAVIARRQETTWREIAPRLPAETSPSPRVAAEAAVAPVTSPETEATVRQAVADEWDRIVSAWKNDGAKQEFGEVLNLVHGGKTEEARSRLTEFLARFNQGTDELIQTVHQRTHGDPEAAGMPGQRTAQTAVVEAVEAAEEVESIAKLGAAILFRL